jgi:hypothetical protein
VPIDREEEVRISMLFGLLSPDWRDGLKRRDDNIMASKEINTFPVLTMKHIDFEFNWQDMAIV